MKSPIIAYWVDGKTYVELGEIAKLGKKFAKDTAAAIKKKSEQGRVERFNAGEDVDINLEKTIDEITCRTLKMAMDQFLDSLKTGFKEQSK